jgi:hypothetical protein
MAGPQRMLDHEGRLVLQALERHVRREPDRLVDVAVRRRETVGQYLPRGLVGAEAVEREQMRQ